ncbi:thrombospondin-1-like [Pollicipes pollicipes]|uniref:thrombospondin-1-like n=1 Tax=Pollicipes pollicipes TaxID=41117 RepID=UPI0018853FA2|nr:thrombospondin-1-like [Pollicipes pollicipes]
MLDLVGDDCEPPSKSMMEPVVRDGGWGMWSAWECSADCDGGFGSRERLCNNPEPTLWGHNCPGWDVPRQFGLCNNHKCGTFSDEVRLRMLYSLANDPYLAGPEGGGAVCAQMSHGRVPGGPGAVLAA